MSPPVVRVLDDSLNTAQFTQEQLVLMENALQRRLAPIQQQSMELKTRNHTLTMELTVRHALDQDQRDLFPPQWEDPL